MIGKQMIFKKETKNTSPKSFFKNLPYKNAPKVNKAIGEAVAPIIEIDFFMEKIKKLSKLSIKKNFEKLKAIPIKTEIISGFLINVNISFETLFSLLYQYLIIKIEINIGITK